MTPQGNERVRTNDPAAHPDPITNAPGYHPMGTGIGAAAGGAAGVAGAMAAGALAGSAVGPVGAAAGAAIGAIAGGLIGKGFAEGVNPSEEHAFWRQTYATRPYITPGMPYDEYGPAYQYGWEARGEHAPKHFDEVESSLEESWESRRGHSKLSWEEAKHAARDAWERIKAREHDRH